LDFNSDEYLRTWMIFRYLFKLRDKVARSLKTSPESLIELESLYLVSRTGKLDLLHFGDLQLAPLSMKVLMRYRRDFRDLMAAGELAKAQAGYDRRSLLDEINDLFKEEPSSSLTPKSKSKDSYLTKQEGKEKRREIIKKKYTCKKAVYENATMLAPDGSLLCHTDHKKANWYVSRGLAKVISQSDDALAI
jgi:hypothetical protein